MSALYSISSDTKIESENVDFLLRRPDFEDKLTNYKKNSVTCK
jgi:hypothetical protein